MNAYNLSLAVLLLPAAALGDRFGRRRLFAAGLALFAAASAACALAPDVGWLIAARAVQGVGAAFVLSLSLALVSAAYPARASRVGRRHSRGHLRAGRAGRADAGRGRGRRACRGSGSSGSTSRSAPSPSRSSWRASRRAPSSARRRWTSPAWRWSPPAPPAWSGALVRGNQAGWASLEVSGALARGPGA